VKNGGTTTDGRFSLSTARCLGSCGLAPVAVLDGTVIGKETPEGALTRVSSLIGVAQEA
jgi:bidirectional [NiFe] hydrogenase diaphorase subunit